MKYGTDFGVEIPKLTLRVALFSMAGLPGFILKLFGHTFLNFSILSVCFVGLFTAPGIRSAIVFLLAIVMTWLAMRISQLWSNVFNLSAIAKHAVTYGHCRFEALSNDTFEKTFGFPLSSRLVNRSDEVKHFFSIIRRPTERFVEWLKATKGPGSAKAQLHAMLRTIGYRFVVLVHTPPKGVKTWSFNTFASRDFRFIFIPAPKSEVSPARTFRVAHEIAHMGQFVSVASYFRSEGMMRSIITLPYLACCVLIDWVPAGIIGGILLFYAYLRYSYYPSNMPKAFLRDEVLADRSAVWSVPGDKLKSISDGALRGFVMGDTNLEPKAHGSGRTFSSDRPLSEVEEYRYRLIKEEIAYRMSGGAFPGLRWLYSPFDRQRRAVAYTGNEWESLMGVGLAVLAFYYYELSPNSLVIAGGITLVYLAVAVVLSRIIARRYATAAEKLGAWAGTAQCEG